MLNKYINKKVIIAALVIVIFLIPFIVRVPVKTDRGVFGTYEEKVDFKGLYFADEYVVFMGETVNLKINHKNGDKIPKETQLANGIFAQEAGILFIGLDGYENKFNRNNIKDVTLKEIEKILDSKERLQGVKIINNSEWYVGAFIKENLEFKKGTFNDVNLGNVTYSGQVVDVFDNSEGKLVVFKIKNDLDVINLHRAFNGYIIKSKYNGIIIPSDALINYQNEIGVFVKHNGYAEFKKTNVLYQGEEKAVISPKDEKNGVTENDDLILNPKRVKDGMKVK